MTANPHANANDFTFVFMGDDPFNQFPDFPSARAGLNDLRHDLIVEVHERFEHDPLFRAVPAEDGLDLSLQAVPPVPLRV